MQQLLLHAALHYHAMTSEKKKKRGIKDLLKYVIPLIISIGLCWLLFTGIDFNEMMAIIRDQCDFRWIVLGFVFAIGAQVSRAYRWAIQLRALGIKPPMHALVYSIFGTYAVNLVFPRLGEVWRSGYIAGRENASFTAVFGSMVADRLSDTIAVGLITLLAFVVASKALMSFLYENGATYAAIADLLRSPWLWLGIAACVALVWYFMAHKSKNKTVQKLQNAVKELWQGFAVVVKMPGKGRFLLWTLGIWVCYFMQMYVSFYAFPFTRELLADYGIQAALVTFVLGSISMGVPSNGGIGPWQWAVIFALGIYGVASTPASAFANLSLGTTTLLTIVLGIITFIGIAMDKKRASKTVNKLDNIQENND